MKKVLDYPYNAIEDLIESSPVPYGPEENIRGKELTQDQLNGFEYALTTCTEKEQIAFLLKYKGNKTLKEIGKELGFTPDRARHTIAKTHRKLRHPSLFNQIAYGREGFLEKERQKEKEKKKEELRLLKNEKKEECYVYFSSRTYNALKRAMKNTTADLLQMSEDDFKRVYGLGVKAIAEIKAKLDEFKKKSGEDWEEFSVSPFLPAVSITSKTVPQKKGKKKRVVLIKSADDSISTWFFDSYEKGKKEMDKQYFSFNYVKLESDYAEMSYCGDYGAILHCNGYSVYIWKIVEIPN